MTKYFCNYYIDIDTNNIVKQEWHKPLVYLKYNTRKWINCSPNTNSNYARELYLGEGLGCLRDISQEDYIKNISKWNINDFEFIPEYNHYSTIIDDIKLIITKQNYNSKTIKFAYDTILLFLNKEKDIIDYIANEAYKFYHQKYTVEQIKQGLNKPQIEIITDNFGVIAYLNHQFDEHIIDCEFDNEMNLLHISFSG